MGGFFLYPNPCLFYGFRFELSKFFPQASGWMSERLGNIAPFSPLGLTMARALAGRGAAGFSVLELARCYE